MIPDRFERIARNYPNRVAVKTAKEELTYDELNKAANRVADAILQQCGEGEQPVALLLEHGIHMVVSILGVLKAGKIYVPLNPSNPSARMIETLEDSGAGLMVTNNLNVSVADDSNERACPRLNLDCLDDNLSTRNPGLSLPPKTLASILYTSGSTGRPKGVVGNHRGVLHRVTTYTNAFSICANDRLTLLHHCSVGAAETNLFCSLLNGAALYPFDLKKMALDALAELLIRERITIFHSGVNVYRELVHALNHEEKFPDLRLIKLGSDQLTKKDVELYREHFDPGCILVNALSMSEAGTVSWFVIDKETTFNGDRVPVGYPVEEKEILLLDETGEEVECNGTGEIAIRSQYLSPGYWRRPELTKSKFLPDPNGGDKRTFLTGDLGRILSDGCLLHLGRKDFRVKVRGHTIEPAEIEAALLESHAVKEVAVVARGTGVIASEDAPDDQLESDNRKTEIQNLNSGKRLVAYIVPKHKTAPTINDLRKFLRGRLPDYMIPSAFLFLDSLPLTNGKLDRLALPEPDDTRPELSTPRIAPRDDVEDRLVQVWQKVLDVRPIGINDNFFDLGGDSLSGSRLVSWIHKEFKFNLPVSEFFAAPTIAELARRIERVGKENPGAGKKAWTYLCELQRGEGRKPVFIFPGGGGGEPEFFVYGFLARHVGTEYPFYGLRARGADGILQPHTSVAQMADAYVEEIRAIQPEGPYFLVGECAGGVNAYEAARQLSAQGQEIAMLVLMDVERPRLTKYLRFRAGRCLKAVTKFWTRRLKKVTKFWMRRRWRENYYLARVPFHLKQLRSLGLNHYPEYFLGRLSNVSKPIKRQPNSADSPDQRAAIVLQTGASGQALQRIEWVRESYRRTVRRFHPKLYTGHIEIIVSEKLNRHDPTLGWKKLALEGLRIHPVNGDHASYIREHVAVAGLKLRECLERAEKERASCSA